MGSIQDEIRSRCTRSPTDKADPTGELPAVSEAAGKRARVARSPDQPPGASETKVADFYEAGSQVARLRPRRRGWPFVRPTSARTKLPATASREATDTTELASRLLSVDGPRPDFGWRWQGRLVGVLPDRSFRLVPAEGSAEAILDAYRGNLTSLQACLQCGACTANCSLAGEHSLFPRRQMNLFQMGQHERLLADPTVWHCYNCGDCSTRCATGAKPGKLMGAVRQMAVERFAFPGFMASLVNRPRRWWLAFGAAAVLLLGAIGLGGSFSPATDQVRYASMLPHLTLNVFFFAFSGLALAGLAVGAARAWNTYQSEPLWQARPGLLVRALRTALSDVLAHRRFSDCGEHRLRGYAHLAVFYGFVTLAGLAGVAALLILAGRPYPLPATSPFKILGNVAAGLLILGTAYFAYERWRAARGGDPSTYFDWLLLVNLLAVGVTGVLCEVFRYKDIPLAAYPAYFLHLVSVFVLLVFVPYSKLAHVCYRTVALTSREYDALLAGEIPGEIVSPIREPTPPLLDRLSLGPQALAEHAGGGCNPGAPYASGE